MSSRPAAANVRAPSESAFACMRRNTRPHACAAHVQARERHFVRRRARNGWSGFTPAEGADRCRARTYTAGARRCFLCWRFAGRADRATRAALQSIVQSPEYMPPNTLRCAKQRRRFFMRAYVLTQNHATDMARSLAAPFSPRRCFPKTSTYRSTTTTSTDRLWYRAAPRKRAHQRPSSTPLITDEHDGLTRFAPRRTAADLRARCGQY